MSRLLIHLTIQTMLLYICYFAADKSLFFEKYSASSVRLNHRYRTETKIELYLCLRYCLDDPRCLAINHNETSSACELNDKNCFFQDHTKEEETGWDIYNALKDCGDPGGIPNATLKVGANTLTGSVAKYTCDAGYSPYPNNTGNKISCGPDGVWGTIGFSCEVDTMGEHCNDSTDCLEPMSRCVYSGNTDIGKRCHCQPLYEYVEENRTCEQVCRKFLSTFTPRPGRYIYRYNVQHPNNSRDLSVKACKNLCLDLGDECPSFEIGLGYCFLNSLSVGQSELANLIHDDKESYDLYERDCH